MAAASHSYQVNNKVMQKALLSNDCEDLCAHAGRLLLVTGRSMKAGEGGGKKKAFYCSLRKYDKTTRTGLEKKQNGSRVHGRHKRHKAEDRGVEDVNRPQSRTLQRPHDNSVDRSNPVASE